MSNDDLYSDFCAWAETIREALNDIEETIEDGGYIDFSSLYHKSLSIRNNASQLAELFYGEAHGHNNPEETY